MLSPQQQVPRRRESRWPNRQHRLLIKRKKKAGLRTDFSGTPQQLICLSERKIESIEPTKQKGPHKLAGDRERDTRERRKLWEVYSIKDYSKALLGYGKPIRN